ncbi:hypothetical protein P692DRAFT_20830840 [Suillus brevipes Sb2]|nr:hypothetical protein P692DRAFT_20830840 [Suillus brevipes Sb2]
MMVRMMEGRDGVDIFRRIFIDAMMQLCYAAGLAIYIICRFCQLCQQNYPQVVLPITLSPTKRPIFNLTDG